MAGLVVPTWRIATEPDPYLSTIIGDVLCNLRSALHYVAWELAAKHAGRTLVAPPTGKDKISFPIVFRKNDFIRDHRKAIERYDLPTTVIDQIESVQPYGGGDDPLRLFVDSDKHRLPILIRGDLRGCTVVIQQVGPAALPADPNPAAPKKKQRAAVHAQLAIFVALQDAAMPREPVERTLENIVKGVADVIACVQRG